MRARQTSRELSSGGNARLANERLRRVSRLIITDDARLLPILEEDTAFSDLSNVQVGLSAEVKGHQEKPALIGSPDAAAKKPVTNRHCNPARMRHDLVTSKVVS